MIFCRRIFCAFCLVLSFYAAMVFENRKTFSLFAKSDAGATFAGMTFSSVADLQRRKREVVKVSLPDPDDCMLACADELGDRYESVYGKSNSEVSPNIFDHLSDVDELVKFCQIYTPSIFCDAACPDSRLKRLMTELKVFAMLICQWSANNYTDLTITMKYWKDPGRSKAIEHCSTQCENVADLSDSVSVELEVSHTILKHTQGRKCWFTETSSRSITYDDNSKKNTELYQCDSKCRKPILEKLYGSKIVELDNAFNTTIFKGVYNSLKELSMFDYELEECKPWLLMAPEVKIPPASGKPKAYKLTTDSSCNEANVACPSFFSLIFLVFASLHLYI